MKTLLPLLFWMVLLSGCTRPQSAHKTLERMGYKEIDTTGYRFFACGEDYWFHTGFVAVALNGERVTGTVCSGLLKGSTVKLDD